MNNNEIFSILNELSRMQGIRIRLERNNVKYTSDETIKGEVIRSRWLPDKNIKICLEWTSIGEGYTDSGEACYTLDESRLQQGEDGEPLEFYRYPFELSSPNGPFSYPGNLFSIDWKLIAYLELQRAPFVYMDQVKINLLPGVADEYCLGPKYAYPEEGYTRASGLGILRLSSIRKKRFWKKLGSPDIKIEPTLLQPGEFLFVRIRVNPKEIILLDDLIVELSCAEEVFESSSFETPLSRKLLHRQKRNLDLESEGFFPGDQNDLSIKFRLPSDVPITFASYHHRLSWQVKLLFVPKGAKPIEYVYPITVYPGVVRSPFRG